MKKISEMSLEELQDYAVELESNNKGLTSQLTAKDTEIAQLNEDNKLLQRRNNALFLQVEQGTRESAPTEEQAPAKAVESCEDFAKNLINNGRF